MADTSILFDVLARDRASAVFGKVGSSADGLGAKLSKVGKIAATAIAGAAVGAVAGLGAAMVQGVRDAIDYETLGKKTAAVIKSTGNAANITVKGIQSMAAQLESLSGVDETLIINSENVLATFTNLRNVGTDRIFDQATQSALDMSVALGTDMQSAAILVGKALNDPIKGVTALTRVGVTLTEQQKEQIKTLTASGHTLDAQKVILKELTKEFGGAAKAAGSGFAGSLARLKDAFSDAFRDVGATILPDLTDLVVWLGQRLPPVMKTMTGLLDDVVGGFKAFASAFTSAGDDITSSGINGKLEELGEKIQGVADVVLPILKNAGDYLKDNFVPILGTLAGAIAATKTAAFVVSVQEMAATFLTLAASSGGAGSALLALAGGPVTLIVAAIAAVAAGVVYAYFHFQAFRDVVDGVAQWLTATVGPLVAEFAGFVADQFADLVAWTQAHWGEIQEAITHVVNVVSAVVTAVVSTVQALWRAWGDDLMRVAQVVWGFIASTVQAAVKIVSGVIELALALINGDWGKAWDAVKQVLAGVWDLIEARIRLGVGIIRALIGGIVSTIAQMAHGMWQPLVDAWSGIVNFVSGLWTGLWDGVRRTVGDAVDWIVRQVDRVTGPLRTVVGAVGNVGGFVGGALGHIPGFALGGMVPGALGAPQLAVVHGGEQVLTPDQQFDSAAMLDELRALRAEVRRQSDQMVRLART